MRQYAVHWSARHTRLRYQAVLTCLIYMFSSLYGVKTLKVPGILEFDAQPDDRLIISGILGFSVFTLVSFILQHRMEVRSNPSPSKLLLDNLKTLEQYLLEGHWFNPNNGDGARDKISLLEKFSETLSQIVDAPISVRDLSEHQLESFIRAALAHERQKKKIEEFEGLNEEFRRFFPGRFSTYNRLIELLRSDDDGWVWLNSLLEIKQEKSVSFTQSTTLTNAVRQLLIRAHDARDDSIKTIRQLKAELRHFGFENWFHAKLLPFWMPLTAAFSLLAFGGWNLYHA